MATNIQRITNANLYLNGGSFLGKAQEVTLPDIKAIMTTHPALGMAGQLEFPSGLDKLESTIKMNGLYPEIAKLAAHPFATVPVMGRASQGTFDGTRGAEERRGGERGRSRGSPYH